MKKVFRVLDILSAVSFGFYAVQQVASALMPPQKLPTQPNGQPQGVGLTFLIPALNEAAVIEATLHNVRATVPEARVVVIDDASDDGTDDIVRRVTAADPQVQLLRRDYPNARQNKSKAMNWAAEQLVRQMGGDQTQQVFVGLDADGRVGPDFAPQVRGAFADPDVMAAQGWMRYRLGSNLPGWRGELARMLLIQQDLENFILGHYQRVRHAAGTASLTGNGQVMRASYVAQQLAAGVQPWPDVLLEDFASALEIRLQRPQNRIAMLTAQVGQQGMVDPMPFIQQRARWTQGTMECLPYLPRLLASRSHPLTKLDFSYMILGPWLNAALQLGMLAGPLRRRLGAEALPLPKWAGTAFTALPLLFQLQWAVRYCREKGLPPQTVLYIMATLPIFSVVTLPAQPLAFYRFFSGQKGWYKSVRQAELPGSSELSPS